MRDLSDGKPIGMKLCVGKRREFIAICKAFERTGILPEYISIDGGEGGTGAAPLEFSKTMGTPTFDALIFVNDVLNGFACVRTYAYSPQKSKPRGLLPSSLWPLEQMPFTVREHVIGFRLYSSVKMHISNTCPTGIATQDPNLVIWT